MTWTPCTGSTPGTSNGSTCRATTGEGNPAVYKGHDTIHRTLFAKTGMSIESVVVRAVTSDVAVAVATMKFGPVVIPSGQELPELKTRGSFVLVKRGGIWKVAHFHNTSVDAEAEQNDPVTWDESGFLGMHSERRSS